MHPVFTDEPLTFRGPSLFLCGPTPRTPGVPSWRPEALDILDGIGFEGTVLVPERRDWEAVCDYSDQVEWEFAGLERADALVFWVPRDRENLPGFTTNVEFGRYVGSGRAVYGRPEGRPHNRYLDWLYQRVTGQTPLATLEETLRAGVALARPVVSGRAPEFVTAGSVSVPHRRSFRISRRRSSRTL